MELQGYDPRFSGYYCPFVEGQVNRNGKDKCLQVYADSIRCAALNLSDPHRLDHLRPYDYVYLRNALQNLYYLLDVYYSQYDV